MTPERGLLPIRQPPLRYPNTYIGFVVVSALDLVFTGIILGMGGREVNIIANAVLMRHGFEGMIAYKFALVALVVVLCELIGRRNDRTGYRLAWWAVGVTCLPVLFAGWQLVVR